MELNKYIDHTLLKPDATYEMIDKLCEEAKEYRFFSVCVNGCHVKRCVKNLKGTDVKVCTVVGFPLGAVTTNTKVFETKEAIENGASEIDMVINIGALKSKDFDLVYDDIKAVVEATRNKALLKVIIETCLLTDEEIIEVSNLAVKAGCEFVKTSTGFSTSGANERVVELMKKTVKEKAKVKASGGIRDKATALKMIEKGAERLGVSAGVKIVTE